MQLIPKTFLKLAPFKIFKINQPSFYQFSKILPKNYFAFNKSMNTFTAC
jgi:hypothetical protein